MAIQAMSAASIAAHTDFGLSILRHVANNQTTIFSPISIGLTLTMIQFSNEGPVSNQIKNVFPSGDDYIPYKWIGKKLRRTINGVKSNFDSRFYIQQGRETKEFYKNMMEYHFNSNVTNLNFQDTNSVAQTVNDYVKSATKNQISYMINSSSFETVDSDAQMMLISPAYMKADWKWKFDNTKEDTFFVADGIEKKIAYMEVFNDVLYGYNEVAHVFTIPFADTDYAFSIFSPRLPPCYNHDCARNKIPDVAVLRKELNSSVIADLLSNATEMSLEIAIPKFSVETEISYKEPLKALGITDMFTPGVDLSGISDNVYVTHALQKTKLQIHANGTNVAQPIGVRTIPSMSFRATSPFIFMVTFEKYPILMGEFHG